MHNACSAKCLSGQSPKGTLYCKTFLLRNRRGALEFQEGGQGPKHLVQASYDGGSPHSDPLGRREGNKRREGVLSR